MWESVIAAIAGIASVFMQNSMNRQNMHDANLQSMHMTERLNSQQYDLYNSPEARASALSRAGLSDAAIGAALSGYSGQSGITMTSQPIQPTSIGSTLSDLFSSLQNAGDLERKKKETQSGVDYNASQIKLTDAQIRKLGVETGLKGRELDLFNDTYSNLVAKSLLDNEKLASESNLNDQLRNKADFETRLLEIEHFIKDGTKDAVISEIYGKVEEQRMRLRLTDSQINQITANIALLNAQADAILDLEDVRQKEAAEAEFYKQFLEQHDITWDSFNDMLGHGVKVLDAFLSMFNISHLFAQFTRRVKTY